MRLMCPQLASRKLRIADCGASWPHFEFVNSTTLNPHCGLPNANYFHFFYLFLFFDLFELVFIISVGMDFIFRLFKSLHFGLIFRFNSFWRFQRSCHFILIIVWKCCLSLFELVWNIYMHQFWLINFLWWQQIWTSLNQ